MGQIQTYNFQLQKYDDFVPFPFSKCDAYRKL